MLSTDNILFVSRIAQSWGQLANLVRTISLKFLLQFLQCLSSCWAQGTDSFLKVQTLGAQGGLPSPPRSLSPPEGRCYPFLLSLCRLGPSCSSGTRLQHTMAL
ncbi:unnamed protein product [Arctogadus glacialis]